MSTIKSIKRTYYLILFLYWLAVALPLPIFVLLLQARSINLLQIGIIMGIYSLSIVLLELPTGGLADAVGRKKVALLAYAVILCGSVVLFFAFSFWAALLGMVLYGIGRALSSGALDAWFVDSLQAADPEIALQPALAQADIFTLTALGIGTLLGGLLPGMFMMLPADGTAVLTPLSTTLILSSLLKVALLIVIIVGVHEKRPLAAQSWRKGITNVPAIMKDAYELTRSNNILKLLLSATLVGGLSLAAVETFWQPRFAAILGRNLNDTWIFGVVMAGSFLMGVAGNIIATPLSKRLNNRYAIVAAIARGSRGVFLIGLGLAAGIVPAIILFWLVYLNAGLIGSPQRTLINNEIPSERRSTMLSVESLASYVGGFIGSVFPR